MDKVIELDDIKDFTKEYLKCGKYIYRWSDSYIEDRIQLIDTCDNLYMIIMVMGKQDVLGYLNALHNMHKGYEQEIANAIYARWTMLEKFYDSGMCRTKLLKFMKMAEKPYGQVNIKYMPKILKVYRGVRVEDYKGLSWTRNKKVAEWFANRDSFLNNKCGYVFSGELAREDIIAKFNGRQESEVVCDWKKVRNIQCEKVLPISKIVV
ncbi:hypothetical protein [Lacrimispora indolis]|uniref:hypothetical protein n=1 Tax=Lacrimispora indolis TaxID=69825 RepID=UPI00041A93A6|nr:hypothetical protein [[Clostridium] methoxybenzovorans]